MSETEVLKREVRGNVGTVVFNRPERKNALSPDMLVKLHLTLKEWAEGDAVRAVVVTGGEGKVFSSGYDILSIPTSVTEEEKELLKQANPLELALRSVKNYPYPTIAMVNGYVFGGALNLCMCCDLRIAADDIKAGMPPAKLGLVYHPEGLKQFIEVLGMARTREVFFTGRTYEGREILEMGLVDRLVPRSELAAATYRIAEEIAGNAPLSLKGSKRILNMLAAAPQLNAEDLQEAERIITEAFNSADLKEGQTAFLEKRKPRFIGR
ncbi:MAG: enoyl-CoA hydratase-related protein [bacterium]